MVIPAGKAKQSLLLMACAFIATVVLCSCSPPYHAEYGQSDSVPTFSTYSEYVEWLDSESDTESDVELFDAAAFLERYVADFVKYTELINGVVEVDPDVTVEGTSYCRVVADRLDTKDGISGFLRSFMTEERAYAELEFLTASTTADGAGNPPYSFVDGSTYLDTEYSGRFYPGTWDVSTARPVFVLDSLLRITFEAYEGSAAYGYTAEFVNENGVWLLDSISQQ